MEAAYVYRLAGALGSELQRLSDRFGTASLAGLVPQVVRLLELLETLAADGTPPGSLLGAPSDEGPPGAAAAEHSRQVAEERLAEAQERERRLQSRLTQLEEEQQRALSRLARVQAQEEGPGRRERELMLQLKEVVDHQRDKIRAQDHEIQHKARDTEALQEQLNRFMTVNENLRRKVAVVQAQLRSALERKGEAEALWEAERRGRAAGPARTSTPTEQEEGDVGGAAAPPEHPPDQCTFSKEELQQILQERNELKTRLFLVEEELDYYQRELLNGERVPALLLHAVKSAIKKQRKKIWAKMLGTEEEPTGREEEEEEEDGEGWPIGSPGSDHTDGHLPESRIKSFFSQWYHRSAQPSPTESRPGTWEIITAEDVGPGEEENEEAPPGGSSSPAPTSPLP
ncbi:rab-interacting lysosomal protein [Protobothrops mucrosquamatus]|uniref:rab-interacting lysosomal protein n=1 Tax=Protobothrops mucrosquamatus TaxID=103944 RepID=UPI000775F823|nr:rab-interacting lysosomal protein [Protobothrops mucrosquamatus]